MPSSDSEQRLQFRLGKLDVKVKYLFNINAEIKALKNIGLYFRQRKNLQKSTRFFKRKEELWGFGL